jgi:hypothetical protein
MEADAIDHDHRDVEIDEREVQQPLKILRTGGLPPRTLEGAVKITSNDIAAPRWSMQPARSVRQKRSILPRAGASYGRAWIRVMPSRSQHRRNASPR